jgi:hypothetical protein
LALRPAGSLASATKGFVGHKTFDLPTILSLRSVKIAVGTIRYLFAKALQKRPFLSSADPIPYIFVGLIHQQGRGPIAPNLSAFAVTSNALLRLLDLMLSTPHLFLDVPQKARSDRNVYVYPPSWEPP